MKKRTHSLRKKWILAAALLLLIALTLWVIGDNLTIEVTEYELASDKLPASFDGFTIVQVSDLHNALFGKDNATLLARIESQSPDLIVLTGDLIDCRHTDVEVAIRFAEKAVQLAPVYMVTGNHENGLEDWQSVRAELTEAGVILLEDSSVELVQGDGRILLSGLQDSTFLPQENSAAALMNKTLDRLAPQDGTFHLLLSHRPEHFEDVYIHHPVDLVLTGHAHGGQFRLPFIGGIYAPGQGLFPKYTDGIFTENGVSMVVSRGLGNSSFPIRIANSPELVIVKLKCA